MRYALKAVPWSVTAAAPRARGDAVRLGAGHRPCGPCPTGTWR